MYLNKIPNIIIVMKKFIIVVVAIFFLLSLFASIIFIKKQINGKKYISLNVSKITAERGNENFADGNEDTNRRQYT